MFVALFTESLSTAGKWLLTNRAVAHRQVAGLMIFVFVAETAIDAIRGLPAVAQYQLV